MKQREQADPNRSKLPFSSTVMILFFLFTFICFFPNPALPIGASTGLQAGQIMALLFLPILLVSGLPKRQTLALLLLILPLLLSGFLAVLTAHAISDEVVVKTMMTVVLAVVVLVPAGEIINKKYTMPLLSGVAWAIILHLVVGLYQAYWFTQNVFPLSGLYQNPSFTSSISKNPETWALYVKRPFGLFPEPSAMAASIGPWLVLIVGLLLYPRLRRGMTRGTRTLLAVAAVCGVGLILMSSSGFTIWLLSGLLLVGLPTLKNNVLRLHRRPGSLLVLVLFVLVGAAIAALSVIYAGSRLSIGEDSSWAARLASIVWGISYLGTGPHNLFFGVGPGQSFLILNSPGSPILPGGLASLPTTAVWSVVVNYVQETGLLGALALALILIMVLRAIFRSSARLIGLSCLMVWLAGVVFTTSYLPLSPVWLFLGVLLGWDRIFKAHATLNGLNSKLGVSSARSVVKA